MNDAVTTSAALTPVGSQPTAVRTPWPFGLRVLFVLCCLSVLTGGAQLASLVTIAQRWFGGAVLQAAYWVVGWVLAVAAVAAGALGRRRAFGILSLVCCSLHVVMSSYFNVTITNEVVAGSGGGVMRNVNTLVFLWNWLAIAFNAAVCAYLLRYEWPRWRAGEAAGQRGFLVTGTETV